jgi:acyl dehydratase
MPLLPLFDPSVARARLSGDYNPLHIDPSVSSRVGYPQPILHGLATMGISVRQLLAEYGADQPDSIANIKVGRYVLSLD